jgi:hypothetical protein
MVYSGIDIDKMGGGHDQLLIEESHGWGDISHHPTLPYPPSKKLSRHRIVGRCYGAK